jgi:hypothetical protein
MTFGNANGSDLPSWRFGQRARKPAGGFCFVTMRSLLRAWQAYRDREIRLVDLRAWLACIELVARRCELQRGRNRHYRVEELRPVIGGPGGAQLRRSIGRLESSGLLAWSESAIRFEVGSWDAGAVAGISPRLLGRKVPVPRRMIRHLAAGSSRAVMATAFAHLVRCLHYRDGQCVSGGFCKASWISETFGVHERNVKAARQQLIRQGWLLPASCPQRVMNGLGMGMEINLLWTAANRGVRHADSAPPILLCVTGTPPPRRNMKLSSRLETQNPPRQLAGSRGRPAASGAPVAVRDLAMRSDGATAGRALPHLHDVTEVDLRDDQRLGALFAQAIQRNWVHDCDSDRLNFWAAAEHARTVGTRNVPGLFVWVVSNQRWNYITQRDEDGARQRLAGPPPRVVTPADSRVSRETWSPVAAICSNVLGRLAERRQKSVSGGLPGRDRTPVELAGLGTARQP